MKKFAFLMLFICSLSLGQDIEGQPQWWIDAQDGCTVLVSAEVRPDADAALIKVVAEKHGKTILSSEFRPVLFKVKEILHVGKMFQKNHPEFEKSIRVNNAWISATTERTNVDDLPFVRFSVDANSGKNVVLAVRVIQIAHDSMLFISDQVRDEELRLMSRLKDK